MFVIAEVLFFQRLRVKYDVITFEQIWYQECQTPIKLQPLKSHLFHKKTLISTDYRNSIFCTYIQQQVQEMNGHKCIEN